MIMNAFWRISGIQTRSTKGFRFWDESNFFEDLSTLAKNSLYQTTSDLNGRQNRESESFIGALLPTEYWTRIWSALILQSLSQCSV